MSVEYRAIGHSRKPTILPRTLQNAGVWANLGTFYLLHGNKQLAHQAFAQAQAHDPSLARAWVGQALVAESMGDEVTDDLFRHTAELNFEVCECLCVPRGMFWS